MKLLYLLPAAFALLLAAIPADAGCRRVVQTQAVVVTPAIVTTPVAVTTTQFLAVPQIGYPVMGATYGGDVAGEIRALRQALERLAPQQVAPAAGFAMPKAEAPSADSRLVSATASCVRCHGVAPKGNTLSLAPENLGKVTREQWKEAYLRVTLPAEDPLAMPQGGKPVTDEQLLVFAEKAKAK